MTDMNEILKAQEYITSEILEYVTNDVVTKTILKKTSGTVSIMAFDQGQGLLEKSSPFDHFMQFIDGSAETCHFRCIYSSENWSVHSGTSPCTFPH